MDYAYPQPGSSEEDFSERVADRLTADWLLAKLVPWERELMILWAVEDMTNSEIGKILGKKYRGRVLTGGTIRYHKGRIRKKLADLRKAAGL
jgi:DNA-directed RNA polymerase specialized sigma24 family protein